MQTTSKAAHRAPGDTYPAVVQPWQSSRSSFRLPRQEVMGRRRLWDVQWVRDSSSSDNCRQQKQQLVHQKSWFCSKSPKSRSPWAWRCCERSTDEEGCLALLRAASSHSRKLGGVQSSAGLG